MEKSNLRNKKNLKSDSGRSMVEMLGVLAIMGLLSIGGLVGYSAAVNRYRANTVLDEANKRAISIADQISMNRDIPSIDEFYNNDLGYAEFQASLKGEDGITPWKRTDKTFTLSITGVNKNICNQMKDLVEDAVRKFEPDACVEGNDNTVKLTYNNDLSSGDLVDETTEEESCPVGVLMASDGLCSVCENGNVYLSYKTGHECDTETPFEGCKNNDDCAELGDNYYCHLKGSNAIPTSGTCKPITSSDYTDASIEGLGTVRKSNNGMSWWAAENWCKAQGKSLIDVSELQCYHSGTNNLFSNGASTSSGGSCCRGNGQTCDIVWYPYWDSNTIKSGSETIVNSSYSPIFVNLRKTFGSCTLWTASSLVTMDAYYLDIGAGYVSYSRNNRSMGECCPSIFPLCK